MGLSLFLIIFSAVMAFLLLIVKKDRARSLIVCVSAAIIAAGSIAAAVMQLRSAADYFAGGPMTVRYIMLVLEAILAVCIAAIGIRHRNYTAPLMAVVQCILMIWFELRHGGGIEVQYNMYADQLTVIMILITGVVGSLICVFASGSRSAEKDGDAGKDESVGTFGNRRMLSGLYLCMAAMFGLVSSSNLAWMYFFWQVSTVAVFLLMPAGNRALRGLSMHLLSGLFFVIGIIILGIVFGTLEISTMLIYGSVYGEVAAIPAAFLAVASFAKAGQMPFGGWLRDAGSSPAPAFAMVHSFGPVAAGAFLIIKMAPLFGMTNFAGIMVMMVGGITFLFASFAAISCDDFKDTVAYSTAAFMGLAVACGGIGSAEAVWAAIMLLIFHAIAKALLIICLGQAACPGQAEGPSPAECPGQAGYPEQAEGELGRARSDDLTGLFTRMPVLTVCMIIASAGMFLAPLGMLIAQWKALSSAAGSGNFLIAGMLCFGIAAAAYSQARWIGILAAPAFADGAETETLENETAETEAEAELTEADMETEPAVVAVNRGGIFSRNVLAVLLLLCSLMPLLISAYAVVPYLEGVFEGTPAGMLSTTNMVIMAVMLAVLILLGAGCFVLSSKRTGETADAAEAADIEAEAVDDEAEAADDEKEAEDVEAEDADVKAETTSDEDEVEEAKKEIITVELEPAETEPVAEDPTAFLREIFDERRMVLSGGVLSGVMMVIGIGFIVTSLVSLLGGAAS